MTDKEKAIVMAHTGICMLTGNKFQIFHKYVEDIMKRPIMTHEIGLLADEIKEKSKADFMALCANENNVEEEQEPILDKIKAQINSNLRGVEIALEVLDKNHKLRPKMEGALDTLKECLGIINQAESEEKK